MADLFDANGLQVKQLSDLVSDLETGFQGIYGSDINTDPNSPDGQMINIFAQGGADVREVLLLVNAGFDPDQAEGRTLDQRVALRGIKRSAGSFSTVSVSVVVSAATSLVGLDSQAAEVNPTVSNLYTIKDDAGNKFYLLASQSPSGAGTYSYTFRAAAIGKVQIQPNTISTPVTIVPGVSTVNNPSGAIEEGTDEESDAALRVRFHKAGVILAQGFVLSLEAALQNLPGVASAKVEENDTGSTSGDGTPAHTVWSIVDGGADADIAAVIFSKKGGGCGLRGATTYTLTLANGQTFVAKWDRPTNQNLWIQFSVNLPGGAVDRTGMKTLIAENFFWAVGQDAVSDLVTEYVRSLNPSYRVTSMKLSSDGITYSEIVAQASPAYRWVNDPSRMTIST